MELLNNWLDYKIFNSSMSKELSDDNSIYKNNVLKGEDSVQQRFPQIYIPS